VIFTKLDILVTRIEEKMDEHLETCSDSKSMSNEEFDAAVKTAVEKELQRLCVDPLLQLEQQMDPSDPKHYPWAAVSSACLKFLYNNYSHSPHAVKKPFDDRTETLISDVLKDVSAKVWLAWAMAQRVNATVSIDASIL
jgi:hypothetical protein